jgi:hypothetical protein
MAGLKFKARIEIANGNPFVRVGAARARALRPAWKKPMPVLVRIDGEPNPPWRINLMPIGDGRFTLYLHGKVRKASGTMVGDLVEVELRFDSAYRSGPIHSMPSWFAGPLENNPKARAAFEVLIPSRRKEILRYFAGLKSDDARARNLDRALHVLSGKPGRFMARSWKDGR